MNVCSVQVRGQPRVSFLAFYLVWDRVSCSPPHIADKLARKFLGNLVSAYHLDMGFQTAPPSQALCGLWTSVLRLAQPGLLHWALSPHQKVIILTARALTVIGCLHLSFWIKQSTTVPACTCISDTNDGNGGWLNTLISRDLIKLLSSHVFSTQTLVLILAISLQNWSCKPSSHPSKPASIQ